MSVALKTSFDALRLPTRPAPLHTQNRENTTRARRSTSVSPQLSILSLGCFSIVIALDISYLTTLANHSSPYSISSPALSLSPRKTQSQRTSDILADSTKGCRPRTRMSARRKHASGCGEIGAGCCRMV